MIAFRWTDARGQAHVLDSPLPIEREYEECCAKLVGLKPRIERANNTEYLELRPQLVALRNRIDRLARDLADYNVAWKEEVMRIALETSSTVGGLMEEARYLAALHRCFEHAQGTLTGSSRPSSDQLLVLQQNARRQRIDFVPPATFAEAQQLLLSEPGLNREQLPESAPPFAWRDPAGHYHQIRSVSIIEKHFIRIVAEIEKPLGLLASRDPEDVSTGIEEIRLYIDVVNKLKEQMKDWSSFVLDIDKKEMIELITKLDGDHEKA